MEEVKEIKPASFRISDDVKEKFKEIAKENGWNQDETLEKLVDLYALEQAKVVISGRKTEIETFETHIKAISEIYRMSLQLSFDAEERIKAGYNNTLLSNQKIIQKLQEENEELKNLSSDLQKSTQIAQGRSVELEKENERLKAEIIKTDSLCDEYKNKNDVVNGLLVEYKSGMETNKQLKIDYENLLQELINKNKEIEQIKSNCTTEILALKLKQSEQVEEINLKNIQKLEKANSEYKELLDELEKTRKDFYNLKDEKSSKPLSEPRKSGRKKNEKIEELS